MPKQTLIVNNRGEALFTFGKLLPRHWLLHRSVCEDFPVLGSIWDQLVKLPPHRGALEIRYVESPHVRLDGFYHLQLCRAGLYWRISLQNCTIQAQQYRSFLQRRNERILMEQQLNSVKLSF